MRKCKVYEDAVMAGGDVAPVGGDIAPVAPAGDADVVDNAGITTNDVLGKDCDHKKDGYLHKGCFHIPFMVGVPCYGASKRKKKRKKTPYEKHMKFVGEFEYDNSSVIALRHVEVDDVNKYIVDNYDVDEAYTQSIAFFPEDNTLFIKFLTHGKSKYVNVDFDVHEHKFTKTQFNDVYSGKAIMAKYKNLFGKKGIDSFRLFVVYGE